MYTDLTSEKETLMFGNDSIVIRDKFEEIRGGRTLDVTGYPIDLIHAGQVVIREDGTDTYKPFPLSADGTAYDALPAGHTIVGVVVATVLKTKPMVGIMNRGNVNPNAAVIPYTAIINDVKAALPLVTFLED